jgi:hypothetical protein
MQLEQGTSHELGGREVGIMNVWPEDDGSIVAQISIHDRATGKSDRVEVKRGEVLTVGAKRYRVADIARGQGNQRAIVTLALEGGQP